MCQKLVSCLSATYLTLKKSKTDYFIYKKINKNSYRIINQALMFF